MGIFELLVLLLPLRVLVLFWQYDFYPSVYLLLTYYGTLCQSLRLLLYLWISD
jgi:hypothetical protein